MCVYACIYACIVGPCSDSEAVAMQTGTIRERAQARAPARPLLESRSRMFANVREGSQMFANVRECGANVRECSRIPRAASQLAAQDSRTR